VSPGMEDFKDTPFKDAAVQFWSRIHQLGYRATNGKALNEVFGMPVIMLTTIGRKSGEPRSSMLTTPVQQGDTLVLVASNGGDHRYPAWYLNLRAHPDVEVSVRGETRQMRARLATAEEEAALWPRVRVAYQGYARYEEWTDREIPLVILEPAPRSSQGS
jgi:deazaflavin-dependent oxidoreductase (nitroreductase family)